MSAVEEMMRRRKERTLAKLLFAKDQDWNQHIPAWLQRDMRRLILGEFNDFYNFCLDVLRSLDTGDVVLNEHWLEKIDEIHSAVVRPDPGPVALVPDPLMMDTLTAER